MIDRTGDVWHVFLKGDFADVLYGYKFDGKFSPEEGHRYDASRILVDPYAKVSVLCAFLFSISVLNGCLELLSGHYLPFIKVEKHL